ncbi:MAG TPA: SpoIIE family protein phosphatase [Candidatus Elarobacter sp.]|nr:SpoIIE family protein phosphatase [Candidatus Elarobacter sp.]
MTRFDARAIENIASAPATPADRRWAGLTAVGLIALFGASIPFSPLRELEVPSFVPAVVGAGVLALVLTAVLLYVQYRIERDIRLALLALAYGYAAITQTLYILTFPGIFSPGGLLSAGPQTASLLYVASQIGFGAFVIATGIATRRRWRLPRDGVRILAIATLAFTLVFTLAVTAGYNWIEAPSSRFAYSPDWLRVVVPLMTGEMLLGLVILVAGLRTVTDVWLGIVLLARTVAIVTGGELASGRYSFGWYAARVEEFLGAIVVLAVFLVKINELMLRLAARSRSTAVALEVGEARYASLANVVPQLIFTANAAGDVEYVNDRWAAYTGYDLNASRDGGWYSAVHPDQEPAIRERWRNSLRTGEPLAAEFRLREERSGRYRWFLVNAAPVRGREGEIVAWIATCTDVDVQKRLEEREAFLARAGERLGASLDVTATVAAMKALLLPRLGDRTWVALIGDDGRYVLTGVGSTDLTAELQARSELGTPLPPALHEAVGRIVASGDPFVLDGAQFPDPWLSEFGAGAGMVVPLHSGDVTIGALALARGGGRPYELDEVALVREFARRAALSLDHARLYERERTTADALQRAMLPAQLPLLPDIRFSASYSAASESQRVGGDFYDAFELPDGRVALTIGDVTGHGLEAAVIMGEIRQALRAASFESADPSAILDRASRLLIASGRSVFVTAIVGVLDPVTGRLAYATAGHPPPLLDDGRELRRLPGAGLPIGLRDEQGVDFALRLRAPCTLVMFTDGLMEFARDLDEGERRIENAIRNLARENIDHLANAVMKEVLGDDEATDDIAILTVTIERFAADLPGDEREWRFVSDDARTSVAARREIGALISAWTGRDDVAYTSELAFGELVANAVRHAPGPVRAIVSTDGDGAATLVVEDSGAGFTDVQNGFDPYAETGRGLGIVRAVADDVTIEPLVRGGTRVSVTFLPARTRVAVGG